MEDQLTKAIDEWMDTEKIFSLPDQNPSPTKETTTIVEEEEEDEASQFEKKDEKQDSTNNSNNELRNSNVIFSRFEDD